jgi:penicillin-binding protein 1A
MNRYLQIPLTFVTSITALAAAAGAVLIGAYYYVEPSLPRAEDLRDIKIQVPLQVYSRDGRLIDEFGEMKRTPVAYEDIPPLLVKAILAAEDEHFFEHPGVDYRGVIRGFLNEISASRSSVGGSTITQQVTRTLNVFTRAGLQSGVQRFVQKFREIILAFRIETEFTKQEILELYLNTYFFGQRSYGVAQAARTYFGKDLGELTVSEVAILAGIPQRPSALNPIASTERAAARRSYVLRRMHETGAITEEEHQAALAEPVIGKHFGTQRQLDAPYVAEMVRAEMVRRFGDAAYTAGFKVTTTVDSRLQKAANLAIHNTLATYDERHGYRGPLAHVELPGLRAAPHADAPAGDTNGAPPNAPYDEAALTALLDDHPPPLIDYETAIVLGVEPDSARVFFARRGEQTIGFEALDWAAPYINDETVGPKPAAVSDVLEPGDVVLFRRDTGSWRLAQVPEVQGALASVDPQDGSVVALTGGYDFFLSNYNRATQAKRQPGSAFKPFVYSAALANGFTTASIVNDSPPDVGYQAELERVWKPENFGGKYFGLVSVRFALQESLNAVSIRMTKEIGVPTVAEHVRRFGFDDVAVPNNLSLALGAGNVAPLDLVTGYATFANGGYRVEHHFIDRITDASGEVIFEANPLFVCRDCDKPMVVEPGADPGAPAKRGEIAAEPALISSPTELYPPMRVAREVISPQNAYLMNDLLRTVVTSGSGAAARRELGRNDLAGKTGTTNDNRDTWFVGFNAGVVAAVWVGFDQERPLGGSWEQGGRTAIPMWIDYMREALLEVPERTMPRPPGIIEHRINPQTGLIASDCTRDSAFEKFDIDHVPESEPDTGCVDLLDPSLPVVPQRSTSGSIFN